MIAEVLRFHKNKSVLYNYYFYDLLGPPLGHTFVTRWGRTEFELRVPPRMFRQSTRLCRPFFRSTARSPLPLRIWTRNMITTRYTKDHEYVTYDDSTQIGSVHITEYAQASLGDVVFVELPAPGRKVEQTEQIGAVESVKAASDIYAPVSGEITEINQKLDEQPSLLNKKDPQSNWLCKIKLSDSNELDALLTEEEYVMHCASES